LILVKQDWLRPVPRGLCIVVRLCLKALKVVLRVFKRAKNLCALQVKNGNEKITNIKNIYKLKNNSRF
jgi:hypothetical protein